MPLLRQLIDRMVARGGEPETRQAGAIPYTVVKGKVVFLIITSRSTGRWIFPKGDPIDGLQPWEVAAQEALEEAGVEGEVETRPAGIYRTMKTLAFRRKRIEVEMYPLRVTRQLDEWVEKQARHRHWVILKDAKRLLSEPRLAEIAARLNRRVLAQPQPQPAMRAVNQ